MNKLLSRTGYLIILTLIAFPLPAIAILDNHDGYLPIKIAQKVNPTTHVTDQDLNSLAIHITEGEFNFSGTLKRSRSRQFSGSDGQVRVLLNPYDGHVIIFSEATGEEFYNYYIPPVSGVGEDPDTMCNPAKEPC